MIRTHRCFDRVLTDSYTRLDALKRLTKEESCQELYPQLKVIAEYIRGKEEAHRSALLDKPTPDIKEAENAFKWINEFPKDDASSDAHSNIRAEADCASSIICRHKAKEEQSEIAYRILKDYDPRPELRVMLDWRVRYEIWCKEHQSVLLALFTIPTFIPLGWWLGKKGYRYRIAAPVILLWAILTGVWSRAVNNKKKYI